MNIAIMTFDIGGMLVAIGIIFLVMLRYHKRLAATLNPAQNIDQEKEDIYLPKSRPSILYVSVIVGWISMAIAESIAIWDMPFAYTLIFFFMRMNGPIIYIGSANTIYRTANTISEMYLGVVGIFIGAALCWVSFIFAMMTRYDALLGISISIFVSLAFAHHPIWIVMKYRKVDKDFLLNHLESRKIMTEVV